MTIPIPAGSSFDAAFYLRTNADVSAAATSAVASGAYPDTATFAYAHYLNFGAKELRNPNAFFNTTYYFLNNLDVLKAFNNTGLNPLTHYDVIGWQEGRNPSQSFNTSYFVGTNPAALVAGVSALNYFENTGLKLGEAPTSQYNNFDYLAYLTANPDVKAASFASGVPASNAAFTATQKGLVLFHWLEFGEFEGRTAQDTSGTKFATLNTIPGGSFAITETSVAQSFTGTTNGDTFTVVAGNATPALISIDGVGGADTISISGTTAIGTATFAVKNVPTVTVTDTNTAIDMSAFDSSVTSLTINNGNTATAISKIASGTALTFATTNAADTVSYATGPSGGVANVTVNADTGSIAFLASAAATTNDVTTINLTASTTASTLTFAASTETGIATVNVLGSAALTLKDSTGQNSITKVDSHLHTGGFTFTEVSITKPVTFLTGAESTTLTLAAGNGADVIQFGGVTASSSSAAGSLSLIQALKTVTVNANFTVGVDILQFSESTFGFTLPTGVTAGTTGSTAGFSIATTATNGKIHNLFLNETVDVNNNVTSTTTPTTGAGQFGTPISGTTGNIPVTGSVDLDPNATNTTGIVESHLNGTPASSQVYYVSDIHHFSASTAVLLGILTTNGTLAAPITLADFTVVA